MNIHAASTVSMVPPVPRSAQWTETSPSARKGGGRGQSGNHIREGIADGDLDPVGVGVEAQREEPAARPEPDQTVRTRRRGSRGKRCLSQDFRSMTIRPIVGSSIQAQRAWL